VNIVIYLPIYVESCFIFSIIDDNFWNYGKITTIVISLKRYWRNYVFSGYFKIAFVFIMVINKALDKT